MSVALSKLRAETEMAKTLYDSCKAREKAFLKENDKKVKIRIPNKFIIAEMRKAAKHG